MTDSAFDWFVDENPFATRAVRPGAIPYHFSAEGSPTALLAALEQADWWGEIIGPHGSGKSTLLQTLIPQLEAAGRHPRLYTLGRGQKSLPATPADLQSWDADTQVVVDGYEQLGRRNRSLVHSTCRRRGSGLLATAHRSLGLTTLWQTSTSLDLAVELVHELLPSEVDCIRDDDVRSCFQKHAGNLRDVFFELYDLYEIRRPR